jgi:hypothetical protein
MQYPSIAMGLANNYTSIGGSHFGGASLGSLGGMLLGPSTLLALTRTGITPPVCNANALCPMAARMLPIAPEWLVNERKTPSSVSKISSNN